VALVLAVGVPVVQVVDVVEVDHGVVAAAGAVGVLVGLGRAVLGVDAHGRLRGVVVLETTSWYSHPCMSSTDDDLTMKMSLIYVSNARVLARSDGKGTP